MEERRREGVMGGKKPERVFSEAATQSCCFSDNSLPVSVSHEVSHEVSLPTIPQTIDETIPLKEAL